MSALLQIESRRAMPPTEQRKNLVVQLGCTAEKNNRISMPSTSQGSGNATSNIGLHPNFNLDDSTIRVMSIHVLTKPSNALTSDRGRLVFPHIPNDQRRDNALPLEQRIHYEKDLSVFRLQQRTDDIHETPLTITESGNGLGLPNEIHSPTSNLEEIDWSHISEKNVIVIHSHDDCKGE